MERRQIPERRSASLAAHAAALNSLDWAAVVMMIIGGINWGLVGALDYNLVEQLFGVKSPLSRLVYALVGLASLYGIYLATKIASRRDLSAP
ncbi:DUF378 domain-containing protein [Massilia cavernae]|uniref:DUF378 domain-containing protein n=2 Tax=Massilia cavernae TaxID=2320864 RepID=A0A418Y7E2_9BURK|nr:DUF378 domain-containing protein [Massilia cavernae]